MDFMKVFDQTVRDIKREVNLKVLKVPEIEQKVLDATDDEPWGPHGTALAEIAQATKKFSECQIVMNVLWARLTETGKNWRFVYKALAVIEYLVAHGSERAVDDVVEHTFQISSLASFEYVEPSGKDLGINVRKKAETIVSLLNNKDKIQETRNKAAGNRDKYVGLSSSGVTFKSGTASFTSSSFQSGDKYGGFGNEKDSDEFGNGKEKDEDMFKSRRDNINDLGKATRKKSSNSNSKSQETKSAAAVKKATKINETINSQSSSPPKGNDDDNFDDFDPRGTFNAKPSAESSNQVDLFGDFLDAPIPVPGKNSTFKGDLSDVDLFADATFVSATSQVGGSSAVEVDLFASQPAPSSTTSSPIDFFAKPDHATQSEHMTSKSQPSTADNLVDPFATIPMNNFDNSDPFGAFAQNPANDTDSLGPKSVGSTPSSQIKLSGSSGDNIPPTTKKDGFQVKSGIWADSLSRGLIDLNITAPKKMNLADVGITGGLVDDPFGKNNNIGVSSSYAFNMGTSMNNHNNNNTGPNLGHSGFSSATSGVDDFFSSLSNQPSYQYTGFKK